MQDWIRVIDRLPKDREECLTVSNDGKLGIYSYDEDYGCFSAYNGMILAYDVIYWMPTPKPPVLSMTNFDNIKKMTVPEMARLLGSIHSDFDEHILTINGDIVFDSFDDIEEWLESEVKDNEVYAQEKVSM